MAALGKPLILLGFILVLVGIFLVFVDKIPYLGKLPGDLHFRRGSVHVHVPIATSILLSLVASTVYWLATHFGKK